MTATPPPPPFPPSTYVPAPAPLALDLSPITAPRPLVRVPARYLVGVAGLIIAGLIGHDVGHHAGTSPAPAHHATTAHDQWWTLGHEASTKAIEQAVSEGESAAAIAAATANTDTFCTEAVIDIDGVAGHLTEVVDGCVAGITDGLKVAAAVDSIGT